MKNYLVGTIWLLGVFAILLFPNNFVHAAKSFADAKDALGDVTSVTGHSSADLPSTVAKIVKVALSVVGTTFLAFMVYGGYRWMMARGDKNEVTKARDTITAAMIGIIVIVMAYVITSFIMKNAIIPATPGPDLGTAQGNPGDPTACCIIAVNNFGGYNCSIQTYVGCDASFEAMKEYQIGQTTVSNAQWDSSDPKCTKNPNCSQYEGNINN